jgi:hypothetical protein
MVVIQIQAKKNIVEDVLINGGARVNIIIIRKKKPICNQHVYNYLRLFDFCN